MLDFLRKFLYILGERKKSLFILVSLFLVSSLLESLGIGLIGPFVALATNVNLIDQNYWLTWVYNRFDFQSKVQFISLLGLIILVVLYTKAAMTFSIQRYIFKFGFSQQSVLRSKLMNAYLNAPYTFHLSRNTATLINTIVAETFIFANHFLLPVLFTASNFVIICALISLLFITDPIGTLSISGILLLAFFLLLPFKEKLARWGRKASESNAEMIRIINHGLGGLKETRVIGCENYFERQLTEQAEIFNRTTTNSNSFLVLPRHLTEALLLTFVLGYVVISLMFNRNSYNLASTLGIFAMASVRLLPASASFLNSLGTLKQYSYVVDKLYFDLKEVNSDLKIDKATSSFQKDRIYPIQFINSSQQVLMFENQIDLVKLIYRYPNTTELAIKGISLTIKKGESIGLIGKSGAGKTTLVDIILGLLTPEDGQIKVDGIDITENLRTWQNLIGYIPQSIFLIDDTIERNIAFGVPDEQIDCERLMSAIQAAQLVDVINNLPNKIKTMVGERGVRLSGGQRQRVGIARALYHEREILVLDEATAALDNETENLVTEAISSLGGTKTLIIIAHRLSTVERCDRIYMLEDGRIVKSGNYHEVVLHRK
ncbi:MAG: ABC transporter ATP-binding protein/permease [Elainella sp. C42_A2020_010]|nr:ABC transporter ATP-binding protein/permease [Elainella sp. C42_A2020_010]